MAREYANGRRAAIQILDTLLAKRENQTKLRDSLQQKFDDDPVHFFKDIAMPLTPRSLLEEGDDSAESNARKIQNALKGMQITTHGMTAITQNFTNNTEEDEGGG